MDKPDAKNILTNLKMPSVLYPVIAMIIFLIIMLSLIFWMMINYLPMVISVTYIFVFHYTSKSFCKSKHILFKNCWFCKLNSVKFLIFS